MIPRYTNKEMGAIWSEERRYGTWLEVELAAMDRHCFFEISLRRSVVALGRAHVAHLQ